ncbi:bacillithiol biosynthesis deacetylase BshB1 [Fulvivirga kasyanovii]|uniref:Bacillithiol biosynthesis deacetylase BshB1 n=1 Tax=Fulvivirga kasyanovii TaxID=396812 RepID=A0ABW9RP35_9BACT|nr:bacillithiol biosynthesis deacetylase BshB1 [Fulvivirga kasyanovii]MTI25451.1 bacillithiol biosynthesis deacetylase BshB1 [Fulvivirga kasyanovii]
MKLDILAFAAHPDDTELSCAGTLAAHIAKGYKVGVVDFTRGEMGTRGTAEVRDHEARESAKIQQLAIRENLGFEDVFFTNDRKHQLEVARAVRKYQPDIVLANAITDRHPDHGKAAKLAVDACFLAGLRRIELKDEEGEELPVWRPRAVYHYIQSNYIQPDFVVDISGFWSVKMQAIKAFKSQFHDPESNEPETFISNPEFMKLLEARAKEYGHSIGVEYAEGFTVNRTIGVTDITSLL